MHHALTTDMGLKYVLTKSSGDPFWVETSAHKNPESTSLSKEDSEVLGCHPGVPRCSPAVWDLPLSSRTGRSSWWRKILSGVRSSNWRALLWVSQGVQCVGHLREHVVQTAFRPFERFSPLCSTRRRCQPSGPAPCVWLWQLRVLSS